MFKNFEEISGISKDDLLQMIEFAEQEAYSEKVQLAFDIGYEQGFKRANEAQSKLEAEIAEKTR